MSVQRLRKVAAEHRQHAQVRPGWRGNYYRAVAGWLDDVADDLEEEGYQLSLSHPSLAVCDAWERRA